LPEITYGIAEAVGWREGMEDAHALWNPGKDFFAAEVYDGHCGPGAANIAARALTPYFQSMFISELEKPALERRPERELLREAYLRTDRLITESNTLSGTAAATFYLLGERFLAANVGDVRIIIGTAGRGRILTMDHSPGHPAERARIEALGGEVVILDIPRIQGSLAVSRALGDLPLKPYITAQPHIVEGRLGRENDLVLLASDGLWHVLDLHEALEVARAAGDPQGAADLIVFQAYARGAADNITAIVLDLRELTKALATERMQILAEEG
jgi:protein phosphatase 1L